MGGIHVEVVCHFLQLGVGIRIACHRAQCTRPIQTAGPYFKQILIQITPAPCGNDIWIICIAVLVACLLLALFRPRQHQNSTEPPQIVTPTNQLTQQAQSQAPAVPPTSNIVQTAPLPPSATTFAKARALAKLASWQAPIEFYGKVVDENNNPVAGATINFHWVETPSKEGNKTSKAQSDAAGLFSLHGARGPDLAVLVSKEGYYSYRETDHPAFKYGFFSNGDFSPDPRNPIVFHLHKKGKKEPLIRKDFPPGIGQIWQLHHDGMPIELDLLSGRKVSAGNGQLKLEFWRDVSDIKASRFDWKLQISISKGGLIGTDEEFAFQAPESGYQPSVLIDMPATNQNWQDEVRSKYYIQLPDGKYGRIDVYLMPYNGVFTVQSAINPAGSRNLEPQ